MALADDSRLRPRPARGEEGPARPALDRLGACVQAYVAARYRPRGGGNLPPARLHARALADLSAGFTHDRGGRKAGYLSDARARAAYVLYYTVTSAGGVVAALELAAVSGIHPRPAEPGTPLRVLDIGAGSLGASLGVAAHFEGRAIDVTALDGTAAVLADGAELFAEFAPQVRVQTARVDLRDVHALRKAKVGQFDLVLCANVLNELPAGRVGETGVAERLLRTVIRDHLAPGGVVLALEPATRMASIGLIAMREGLLADASARVLAPCTHAGRCPLAEQRRDWCAFEVPWQRPAVIAACDDAIDHARTALKASWLVLAAPSTEADASAAGSNSAAPQDERVRVIGGPMHAGGVMRRYVCAADGRHVAAAPAGARGTVPSWMLAPGRGTLGWIAANARRREGRGGEVEIDVSGGRR